MSFLEARCAEDFITATMTCHCLKYIHKSDSLKCDLVRCSSEFGLNPDAEEERRRMVLSLSPVDWAAEWLRLKSPSYKYVGPVLAEPGKALPAHLEVCPYLYA